MSFNFNKELLQEIVAKPYMKNKPFVFLGKIVHPSSIHQILVFKSKKPVEKLILPNGKTIREERNNVYVAKCFARNKVEQTYECTDDFITSTPEEKEEPTKITTELLGKKDKVFIVHGRDETQALRLQKYLTKTLKVDAEMFEDFKERSGSNTIIEQLEYIKDNVGYAFVVVTPDDLGCLREDFDKCRTKMLIGKENIKVESVSKILDKFNSRARQNVVFEHGLFIGTLGRDRVCCLLQKDTKEKPSDIDGILYVSFGKSVKDKFIEITEKLKTAGLVKG